MYIDSDAMFWSDSKAQQDVVCKRSSDTDTQIQVGIRVVIMSPAL